MDSSSSYEQHESNNSISLIKSIIQYRFKVKALIKIIPRSCNDNLLLYVQCGADFFTWTPSNVSSSGIGSTCWLNNSGLDGDRDTGHLLLQVYSYSMSHCDSDTVGLSFVPKAEGTYFTTM